MFSFLSLHATNFWHSNYQLACFSPTEVQRAGWSLLTYSCGVITQYADFQRQHIVQLSPIVLNYCLWILHKAANGYTEVGSQKAESCFHGFHESVPSTVTDKAIKTLLPHQTNYTFLCPALLVAFTLSCSWIRHNEKEPSMLLYFKHVSLGCIPGNKWSPFHSWCYRLDLYTLSSQISFPN